MGGPPQPVRLRLRSGERADRRLSAGEHMELYAEAIHSGRPGLVEVVGAERTAEGTLRMRRRERENFLDAGDRAALRRRGESLSGAGLEVFVTPATLTAPEPGNDAVAESQVAWVDVDEPLNVSRLREFGRRPHLVVESGGSGGLHAYWLLDRPIAGGEVEAANRKLVAAVGGDRQSTNRARLMRLSGTRNRKSDPPGWCRVVMCDLARQGYDVEELTRGLADPKAPRSRSRRWREEWEDPAAEIPPPVYFARLAGLAVDERGELISCPHSSHRDRHPSCYVYPNPGEGWHCFSCGARGDAIDLVSALRGGPTGEGSLRGEEFKRAKRECYERLGLDVKRRRGVHWRTEGDRR